MSDYLLADQFDPCPRDTEKPMSAFARESSRTPQDEIREILEEWARATREGAQEEVLRNHEPEVVIYDVLPPLKYDGAEAYRKSWDEWQPDTEGEFHFDLHELEVSAGRDVGFAHGLIRCAGRTVEGREFEDWVRATFCLRRHDAGWRVAHQHISMPRSVT
jgi:ketosteroid isomerase-like protein